MICCSEHNSLYNKAGRQHAASCLVCQSGAILHGIQLINAYSCTDSDRKVANNPRTALFTSRTYIKNLQHQHTFLVTRYREAKDVSLPTCTAEEWGYLAHVCSEIFYWLTQEEQDNIPFYCLISQEQENIPLLVRKAASESMLQNTQSRTCAANKLQFFQPGQIKVCHAACSIAV